MKRDALLFLLIPLLVCLLLSGTFIMLRYDTRLYSAESYHHVRMAHLIRAHGIPTYDPLTGQAYSFTPLHVLLAILPDKLYAFLPLALALISLLLLWSFSRNYLSAHHAALYCLLLVMSPVFLYFSLILSSTSLFLTCVLIAFFLLRQRTPLALLSFPLFILLAFFPIPYLFAMLALFVSAHLLFKRHRKRLGWAAALFICTALVFQFIQMLYVGIPKYDLPTPRLFLENSITEFGGLSSLGFFYYILAGIGIFVSLRMKKKYAWMYAGAFLLFALSYFYHSLLLLAALYLCYFVLIALGYLFRRAWQVSSLRTLTLFTIFCGSIFALTLFINQLTALPPSPELLQTSSVLQHQQEGIILSDLETSTILASLTEYPIVIDLYPSYLMYKAGRRERIASIYRNFSLTATKDHLTALNVSYIVITPEMKEELWEDPDDGLLFLLRNTETFHRIANVSRIEVWEYLPVTG